MIEILPPVQRPEEPSVITREIVSLWFAASLFGGLIIGGVITMVKAAVRR